MIVAAALAIVQEDGVRTLGISQVLARAELSTRAFYRHFDSKDALLAAVCLHLARTEMEWLQVRMAGRDPVGAVAAWIKGRLDPAFDPKADANLRRISLEARSESFATPELLAPVYGEILRPLIRVIDRGKKLNLFAEVDPVEEAMAIHGVTRVHIERQWATGEYDRDHVLKQTQRFCLRALGVPADVICEVVSEMDLSDSYC